MAIVTGDRYLESLVKFVEQQAGPLIEGTLVLKLNPVGLHYVQSRLESLAELERLLAGAPVDYLRAYVSDLGDHRALEQLRRILRLLTSVKVISVLPPPGRDPTPLSLLPFGRLKVLELRGCDLSNSAARGLLELRHTLEKIICHNSTDALRHVFASRIAEIKDSPQWNRLSFVSCACNGLVLMDESLRLLPVVETLDLSRNKFTKVDNLHRCTRLKNLDLGFNQLRTIASFSKVCCQITKLVLRNNALSTLRGVENLKSLEGLDLSFNIISSFLELELLSGLPSLQSLWLEGNPVCSASWYRAQVFSFFPEPDKVKLDDKMICTREVWKRQIIIASRHKQPASFGFYSPAKDEAELEGSINTKRKRLSRLASIETEVQSIFACSDNDYVCCDNEAQSKHENADSDGGGEIVDFMNRIELIKKERSILWLEEFKEWMNQSSDSPVDSNTRNGHVLIPSKGRRQNKYGETSRYVSDSVQASGDDSSTNILESDTSFAELSINSGSQQLSGRIGETASNFFMGHADKDVPNIGRIDPYLGNSKSLYDKGAKSMKAKNHIDFAVPGGERIPLAIIDDIIESRSSSGCAGSPPQYKEDILHRRHNLEEEFLQLSAESYSVASSDSNTSDSADDSDAAGPVIHKQSLTDDLLERNVIGQSFVHSSEDSYSDRRHNMSQTENGTDSCTGGTFHNMGLRDADLFPQSCTSFPASVYDGETVCLVKEETDWLDKKKCKRKPKKRVVSLTGEASVDDEAEASCKLNGSLDVSRDDVQDTLRRQVSQASDIQISSDEDSGKISVTGLSTNASGEILCGAKTSALGTDEPILNHFQAKLADSGVEETCRHYMLCSCMLEEKSGCSESEVGILLSSEHKLYILLLNGRHDGPGTSPTLVGCHKTEDVKEVLVGLGLQVLRVHMEREARYLFITRSLEKSRQLLFILDFFKDKFSLISLEQIQVALFERFVCGGSKMNIFQYSMVLFWHDNLEEGQWLSRSLFVLQGYMLVCREDVLQFGSASVDTFSPYFSLDLCCSIVDALELVVETGKSYCVTLVLGYARSEFCPSDIAEKLDSGTVTEGNSPSAPLTWKLKWYSRESLFKFVGLLKAIRAAATTAPLHVRFIS